VGAEKNIIASCSTTTTSSCHSFVWTGGLDGRSGRVGDLAEGDVVHWTDQPPALISLVVWEKRESAALCSCSDGSSCEDVLREGGRERRERELMRNGIPQWGVQGRKSE
jgi:hypothetical protein